MRSVETYPSIGAGRTITIDRNKNSGLQNMLEGIREAAIASSVVNWKGSPERHSIKKEDIPEGSINTQALIKKLKVGILGFQRFGIVDELIPVTVGRESFWSTEQQELASEKLERIRIERKDALRRGERLPARIRSKPEIPDGAVPSHAILSEINISQPHSSRLGLFEGLEPINTNGTKYYSVSEARIIKGRHNKYLIYKKLKKEDKKRAERFNKPSPPSGDHVSKEDAAMILGCSRETFARIRRNGHGLSTLEKDRRVWFLRTEIEELRDRRFKEKKSRKRVKAKGFNKKKTNSSKNLKPKSIRRKQSKSGLPSVTRDVMGNSVTQEKREEAQLTEGDKVTFYHPELGKTTVVIVPKELKNKRRGRITVKSAIVKGLNSNGYTQGQTIRVDGNSGEQHEIKIVEVVRGAVDIPRKD